MRRLLLVPALSLALLAAACGDDDQQTRATGGSSTTTSTTAPSTTSTAADGSGDEHGDDVVNGGALVILDVHGGFVPVERSVGNTAEVIVLTDGRLISGAPTIAIYPGPALPAFQVSNGTASAIDAVVDAIEALDPNADYDEGAPNVTDVGTTTVTLHRGGDTVSISAYALGMDDESGPRAQLQAVVDKLNGLATGTGETLYEPTALRVHDVTGTVGPRPEPVEGEPSGTVRDWPLPHDGAACTVVSRPPEVRAALEVLRQSTELDWFRTDVGERRLVVVPLLPGDPGCGSGH